MSRSPIRLPAPVADTVEFHVSHLSRDAVLFEVLQHLVDQTEIVVSIACLRSELNSARQPFGCRTVLDVVRPERGSGPVAIDHYKAPPAFRTQPIVQLPRRDQGCKSIRHGGVLAPPSLLHAKKHLDERKTN